MRNNVNLITEGIKYAGSKKKIIPQIIEIISELDEVKSVLDGFSGTTRVSQAFAKLGYNTTANDVSVWSEVFGNCYLKSSKPDSFYQEIIDFLNSLKYIDGWFTQNYGGDGTDSKRPFRKKNTQKLDAIRKEIDMLNLNWEDKSVLLTSLIYALDKVDNTLGHYAAYLSGWSKRSEKNLKLILPKRFPIISKNEVIRDDIFNTIENRSFDLAYFDPPYGSNNDKMPTSRIRYASYYHIWKTIILNDEPDIFGAANRREDTRDRLSTSIFEEFRKNNKNEFIAMQALDRLIKSTNARYILLSYSSGGRATKEELHCILSSSGKIIKTLEIDHKKNIMSQMRWSNEWMNKDEKHKEYLFLLKK